MSSGWAQFLVALVMMIGTAAVVIWRDGRRNGRVDAILERLALLGEDHEDRIRSLELRRREGRHVR